MNKSVDEQALELLEDLVAYSTGNYPFGTLNDLVERAKTILDQMCVHENVKPNQYCPICGWYHETRCKGCGCDDCTGSCIY